MHNSSSTAHGYLVSNFGGVATFGNSESYSVSVWIKPTQIGKRGSICGVALNAQPEWQIRQNPDGKVVFQRRINSSYPPREVETASAVSINTWHHIVSVFDSVNELVKISIDGGAFEEADGSGTYPAYGGSSRFSLFNLYGDEEYYGIDDDAESSAFEGYIDSVGVYDGVLSLDEVDSLYNSGSGSDYPFPNAGENETQTLTLTGSPSAGNVIVSYQGVGVSVPHDTSAAAAEALFDTITTLGSGNVNVTGGPWPDTALVVEFINDLALKNIEMLEIDTAGITMSTAETTKGITAPTGTVTTTVSPLTKSTGRPSAGPNDWSIAANWHTNIVPVTGDTVYISDTDIGILYGLNQSMVTLAALHIEQTFSGFIGLPRTNSDATDYFEYRDQYLKIGATALFIGEKEGGGSARIKIDLGSVQTTVLIRNSGDGEDANTPAILMLGTHADNVININRGSLGIAYYPTEVSTIAILRQAFFDDAASDTTVYLGNGVTITDIIKSGGVLDINSDTTTFEQTAGETTIHAGAHALLNVVGRAPVSL